MKTSWRIFAVIAGFWALATWCNATTVQYPTDPSNNILPFGTDNAGDTFVGREYQQIHAAVRFGSQPFLITDIGFASLWSGMPLSVDYNVTLRMGVTSVAPSEFTDTFLGPTSLVFSGPVSALFTSPTTDYDLIFHLMVPFLYDPSAGNLLLDVVVNSTNAPSVDLNFRAGSSIFMARISPPGYSNENFGLVTAFSNDGFFPPYDPTVPEPATWFLVIIGLALVYHLGRKKRTI